MSEGDKFAVGYMSPAGIGGWLLWLIIVLWLQAAGGAMALVAERHNHAATAWNLAITVLAASAAYLMTVKNGKGVLLAKICIAAHFAAYLVLSPHATRADIFRIIISCGISVAYFMYLVRSKRVRGVYFPQRGTAETTVAGVNP